MLTQLFFSFDGRINRAIWWAVAAAHVCLYLALYYSGGAIGPSLYTALSLAIDAIVIAPYVKRLHDRNKSGWWWWAFVFAPAAVSILVAWSPDSNAVVLSLPAVGLLIWGFVELGFLPGTPGPNRFGPDPLPGP